MTRTPRTFGQVTEDSLTQVGAPEPAVVEDQTNKPRPGRKPAGDHPAQLNVRLAEESMQLLNKAFAIESVEPNGATSIGGWVGDAIETYAKLSPARRAQLARSLPTGGGDMKVRAYRIPDAVWDRLDAAVVEDRKTGRRSGRSSFAQEAIGVALQRFHSEG